MDLENILLAERCQTQKATHYFILCPEWANPETQINWWLPGAGGKEKGSRCLMGINALESDLGDGCTTL